MLLEATSDSDRQHIPRKPRSTVQLGMSKSAPTSVRLEFVRRNGKYYPAKQTRLKNSLLAGVGFLELANAMDFAANVWNSIPVPLFATILMGVGGTVALALSIFAFHDAYLSWHNIRFLQNERRYLKQRRASRSREKRTEQNINVQMDVSFREIGTEIIDRIGMDSLMGVGAVLVAIGTFTAIRGANPIAYLTSNLLTGYIGNAPSALFGAMNAGWSIYIWQRAHRQVVAGARLLNAPVVQALQKQRVNTIKVHAALNGLTGLIAGFAGIVTTTRWWGYPILVPCIISALYCNSVWRRKIGYGRPSMLHTLRVDYNETVEEIRFVLLAQKLLKESPFTAFDNLITNTTSMSCVMDFIIMHGFFEDFCLCLLRDTELTTAIFGFAHRELEIESAELLTVKKSLFPRLLEIAEASVRDTGWTRFRDRERFLLETLGCELCLATSKKGDVELEDERSLAVGPADNPLNRGISLASLEKTQSKPPDSGSHQDSSRGLESVEASTRREDIAPGEKGPSGEGST